MLGKLIKYEFKATGRVILPLFGALLLVAIVSRLFISLQFKVPSSIGVAIAVILMISVFVIVFVITLTRFYKNLLREEGYLMLTLPVSADSLIWSKLLVAAVWNVLSLLVAAIAVGIMAMTQIPWGDIISGFRELLQQLQNYGVPQAQLTILIVEFILGCIISLFSGIIVFYACMASSLLVNKHRVLFSFGAYIALSIVGQIVTSIVMLLVMPKAVTLSEKDITSFTDFYNLMNPIMLLSFGLALLAGVALYLFTRYMLRRRLNLE